MTSHSNAPARLMRIVAIAIMIAMLAIPAMAAPQAAPAAPMAVNPVTTVTLVSPTTALPFYFPAGQPANFNITYDAGGPGVSGTGERYYQIGAVIGTTGPIASLPVAGGTIPVFLNASETLAGSYDVQVCARADRPDWLDLLDPAQRREVPRRGTAVGAGTSLAHARRDADQPQ